MPIIDLAVGHTVKILEYLWNLQPDKILKGLQMVLGETVSGMRTSEVIVDEGPGGGVVWRGHSDSEGTGYSVVVWCRVLRS